MFELEMVRLLQTSERHLISVTFHREAERIVKISSSDEITGHKILTTISPSVVAVASRLNGPLIPCHINS